MLAVKICGLKSEQEIAFANECQPDYIGFVFAPGRRRTITHETARRLKESLVPSIRTVGVFVDAPVGEIAALFRNGIIDLAQLHGSEDEAYLAALRALAPGETILQAFQIKTSADVKRAEKSSADLLLLDSGQGSGKRFDPELLSGFGRPFFLAGGLNAENLAEAIQKAPDTICGVDVSSGAETDGKKDLQKMREIVEIAKRFT